MRNSDSDERNKRAEQINRRRKRIEDERNKITEERNRRKRRTDDEDDSHNLSLSLLPASLPLSPSSLAFQPRQTLMLLPNSSELHYPLLQMPITHPLFEPERKPEPAAIQEQQQEQEPEELEPVLASSSDSEPEEKMETIPIHFPWATDRRAIIHTYEYLSQNQILIIKGEVHCKKCDRKFEMEFNLEEKFVQVMNVIADNFSTMHDRAPEFWTNQQLLNCKHCGQEKSVKPVLAMVGKEDEINWLFLWLGQLLGHCTLAQLKYFCKHNNHHRTKAKNFLLYFVYMRICQQLKPDIPFDI